MRPLAGAFLLGVSLLAASEVAAQEPLRPPLWTDADIGDIPEPSEREISELFGILYNSWLRHLDLATMHTHRVALNVNAWEYTVEVRGGRRLSTLETTTSADVGRIQIEPKEDATAASPDRWGRTLVLAVDIHTARRDAQLARPVRVFIGRQDQDPELRVLGWIHAPRD